MECRKYLRNEHSDVCAHYFIAVVQAGFGSFHVMVASSRIGLQPRYSGRLSSQHASFQAALVAVDAVVDDLTNQQGYTIAWEAMDTNSNAVPWLEAKSRKFRNPEVIEPDWFVTPAQLPGTPKWDPKDPVNGLDAIMAESQSPALPLKPARPKLPKKRLFRSKAPWNF